MECELYGSSATNYNSYRQLTSLIHIWDKKSAGKTGRRKSTSCESSPFTSFYSHVARVTSNNRELTISVGRFQCVKLIMLPAFSEKRLITPKRYRIFVMKSKLTRIDSLPRISFSINVLTELILEKHILGGGSLKSS